MQEEVNQKTVALSIRTTKLTGKVLAAALGKVARAVQKHHRKALTPQGRQSVKKLMNHYGGKNAMQYVGAPKDFDRIAKEFHVDYAFHKVSPGHYLLFFKANQADAITAAFQKYSTKVLNKDQDKTSILGQLRSQGMTIVVSTPYMDEAARCDRIALCHEGRLLGINTPDGVRRGFGAELFGLSAGGDRHALLLAARRFGATGSCYAFGAELHLTFRGRPDPGGLLAHLSQKGFTDVRLRPIEPGIEDCFMKLTEHHD